MVYFDVNPILHTTWVENHEINFKNNTEKIYFGEKISFLHTNFKHILLSIL